MDYFGLLPEGVRDLPLFSLPHIDLLKYVEENNLEDNFWKDKLKIEFPNKPIIDEENVNLVYWYYVYESVEKEIGEIRESNLIHVRKANNKGLTSEAIVELINNLSKSAQNLIVLEDLQKRLPIYISEIRIKKYGSWPKYYYLHAKEEDRELDAHLVGRNYIVNINNNYQDLKNIDINLYRGKFNNINKFLILAYIYLNPSLEKLLDPKSLEDYLDANTEGAVGITYNIPIPVGATHVTTTIGSGLP